METTTHTVKEKKSRHLICIIFISLFAVLSGVLGWLYVKEKNRANREVIIKEQVFVERDNIKSELLQLQKEYSTLKTNDAALQAELDAKVLEIEELIKQAEKHKNDKYIIAKLRKETETLRSIMKGYVVTIDSLNTLNIALRAEKQQVVADLTKEQGKTTQLTKEKKDLEGVVALGAVLKASGVSAKGVKFRAGGKKEDETDKARRVEKIKVNFILGENTMARAGNRYVFIRVMTPDGKEMTKASDEVNMFQFNGVKGFYAGKQTIEYNNKEMSVKMFAEGTEGFLPGKYIVEVYSDEALIGQTTLNLK